MNYRISISAPGKSAYTINAVHEMLTALGITPTESKNSIVTGDYYLTFATESPLSKVQNMMIRSFFASLKDGKHMHLNVYESEFDFEDYMETDLDGASQEIAFHDSLHDTEKLIMSMIPDERMQGQARLAVSNLYRESLTRWLRGELF
jgi:hypothetical protein